jgi:hypothetical protein
MITPIFARKFDGIIVDLYAPMFDNIPKCHYCEYTATYQVRHNDIYDGEWESVCMDTKHLGWAVLNVIDVLTYGVDTGYGKERETDDATR